MVQSKPLQIVLKTLSWKHSTQNSTSRLTQVIECLLSKCEALSSSSGTEGKKKKKA
jgi:hypothetical protein